MRGLVTPVKGSSWRRSPATRQLRGNEGRRQVKDCRIALCHGTGGGIGTIHSGATVILAKD